MPNVEHSLDEVLFEFHRIGSYVRVAAIDPITGAEAIYIGSSRMTSEMLKFYARRKLYYQLNGRPEASPTDPPVPSGKSEAAQPYKAAKKSQTLPRHHIDLPKDVQNLKVPQLDTEGYAEAHAWLQARGMKPIRQMASPVFRPYGPPAPFKTSPLPEDGSED